MQIFFIALKLVALLSYLGLLLMVILSKTERDIRLYFSIYLGGMVLWQFTSLMVHFSPTPDLILFWYNLIPSFSGAFNIFFVPLTRALLKIKGQKPIIVLAYLMGLFVFACGILQLPWHEVVLGQGGYWVPVYDSQWLYVIGPIGYFFFLVGVVNLVRGFRREKSPVQRNRILYVLIGASLVIVGASTNLTSLRDYPVDIACNLASALILGYAFIRYRLLSLRFVLVRSLMYSVLTALLIAAYLGFVFGLEIVLKNALGYTGPLFGILAIFILAILFLPLRNFIQKLLDRLFFREKIDYQKSIQVFSRTVTSLYELSAILDLVVGTIVRTIKISRVTIDLWDDETNGFVSRKTHGGLSAARTSSHWSGQSKLALWLKREGKPLIWDEILLDQKTRSWIDENPSLYEAGEISLIVPVLLNQRLMGTMNIGSKLAGTMYTDVDLGFLTTLANQMAVALEKSTIFQELRRRLSEQTLLFILSEKFRSGSNFDSVMEQILQTLKSFLNCQTCAIAYFEKAGSTKTYATDELGRKAAGVASRLRFERWIVETRVGTAVLLDPVIVRSFLGGRDDLSTEEKEQAASLVFLPLEDGSDLLGMLILPNRKVETEPDERERELLRTIGAIIAQGILLHRTIVNLLSVETYNENILNSLNDMGDALIILDLQGRIKRVNRAACRMLEWNTEELVGRLAIDIAVGEPLFSETGLEGLIGKGSISNYEMQFKSSTGKLIPMLFSGSVMTGEDGESREIVGIARDMTEHRKAEEISKNLLLMQEIHHRIKNNLQVVSSLLYLQAGYVHDDRTRAMFMESRNRVRSMALIHEKLYRSQTPGLVDFSEYIRDLADSLFVSYGAAESLVQFTVDIADITLEMDTAVPCGLIVNELVSNSLKHAFPAERAGRVTITMKRIERPDGQPGEGENWYQLSVSDDGLGFPEDLDYQTLDTLGLRIVRTLAQQLHGTIELIRGAGTEFRIRFREV